MSGEVDEERLARKQWAQRNSDGKMTFTGERSQSPPGFNETEVPLPDQAIVLTNPELDPDGARYGHAIRHVHVFDSDLSDPDA